MSLHLEEPAASWDHGDQGHDAWIVLGPLYRKYHPRLVGFCWHFVHDRHLAEDIAHEITIKAYKSMPRDVVDPWRWLRHVARNACIDELRKRGAIVPIEEIEEYESDDDLFKNAIIEVELIKLHEALAGLSPEQRKLVRLAYWERKTYEEIGISMGIAATSVRDRLHYCRELLKSKLRHFNAAIVGWGPLFRVRRWLNEMQVRGLEPSLVTLMAIPVVVATVFGGHQAPNRPPATPAVEAAETGTASRADLDLPASTQVDSPKKVSELAPSARTYISEQLDISNGPRDENPGSTDITIGPIFIDCSSGETGALISTVCASWPR